MVEMMIGVMIFALLTGYAVPSLLNIRRYGRVEWGSSRLSFQLQQARSYALANNQSVYLGLDTSTNTLTTWIDVNRNDVRDSVEEEVVELCPVHSVELTSSWASGMFNSHGQFLTSRDQRTVETETTTFVCGSKSQILLIRGSGSVIRQ